MSDTKLRVALLGNFPVRSYFEDQLSFTTTSSLEHPSAPLVNLIRYLSIDEEIDLHVLTLHPHLKEDRILQKDNVTYHFLRGGRLSLQILTLYQLDKKRIQLDLELIRPDLIQAFGTEGPYALAAVTSVFASIIYMQGLVSELVKFSPPKLNLNWLRLFLTQFVERPTIKRAHHFFVESSFSEKFVRMLNPTANIYLQKNLLNPEYFQAERKPFSFLRSILFVGRVTASKGVFELVRAFHQVAGEYPDISLELIGPVHDQGEDARLRGLIDELQLRERVSISGLRSVEYIVDRLENAQMMVYPSYLDTSPNSIYEAMAAGVPVVATKVGGIPDMIVNTFNGVLVQDRDHNALASAMRFLLENPHENQRIGQNGKSTVRKELDPVAAIRNIKQIYNFVKGSV